MAGDYTRREIDNLLAGIRNDYNNKINAEATARANKDNELAVKINNESTARANKDTDLQNQINSLKAKFGDYYTKAEVDSKISSSGGATITSLSQTNGGLYWRICLSKPVPGMHNQACIEMED